jgi:hypothetical protein
LGAVARDDGLHLGGAVARALGGACFLPVAEAVAHQQLHQQAAGLLHPPVGVGGDLA